MELGVIFALGTLCPVFGIGLPSATLDERGLTLTGDLQSGIAGSDYVSLRYWVSDEMGRELANSERRGLDYTTPVHSSAFPTTQDVDPIAQFRSILPGQWLASWQFPRKSPESPWSRGIGVIILLEALPPPPGVRRAKPRLRVTYTHAK